MDHDQQATPSADEVQESKDVLADPFVGRWNRLVSTTNWEKGRIIHEWRGSLMAVNAANTEHSDETWSRIVGGSVSGQHAGRLRRVYERFGDVYDQYDGLYWSHFQSALDWDDAEMWLEGAIQNAWSVAAMRRNRWETMGAVGEDEPSDRDLVAAETDEDFADGDTDTNPQPSDRSSPQSLVADDYESEARSPAGPDFGDEDDGASPDRQASDGGGTPESEPSTNVAVRPFANLPQLPDDLAAAFEAFQLAVLHHKGNDWADVAEIDVLASLDALKALVVAAPA